MKKRPIVRRISVPISDITEAALCDLMPFIRRGMASDNQARRWIVKQVIQEGLFALADDVAKRNSFRLIVRFNVAPGDRRGLAREEEANQIDAVLEAAASHDLKEGVG
jgi:hypothetical protein